jgi:hypothetical protein
MVEDKGAFEGAFLMVFWLLRELGFCDYTKQTTPRLIVSSC